jgi:hypothetical protein
MLISLFYITDTDFFCQYPIPVADARAEALYNYVAEHRAHLLSTDASEAYRITELPFPRGQLIDAFDREVEVGRTILSLPQFRDSADPPQE